MKYLILILLFIFNINLYSQSYLIKELKSFEKIKLPIIPIPPKTVKAMVTASGESFAT